MKARAKGNLTRISGFVVAIAAALSLIQISAWPQCGKERWSVKTGTDSDASLVNLAALKPTTIEDLRGLTAPHPLPVASRIVPVETTAYQLSCTLDEYRLEDDSDYHLVLRDAAGRTMIAEIPAPSCVGDASPFAHQIEAARKVFDASYKVTKAPHGANQAIQITGVGFFDFIHGQTGVAPNGIELHPVLSISFCQQAPPSASQPYAGGASEGALTNADVVALTAAGLGQEVILAKIRTSKPSFDTSPSALIELKKDGVSETIITEMIYRQAGVSPPATASTPPATEEPAAPAPSANNSAGPASGNAALTVYVTARGKKYHLAGCSSLGSSATPITLGDAVGGGYTPCSRCKPPALGQASANESVPAGRHEHFASADTQASTEAPAVKNMPGRPTGETTATGLSIYEGPRGGRYHYSKSGKKVYERRKK